MVWGHKIILYLNCDGGYMNLYIWQNCIDLYTYEVHISLCKTGEIWVSYVDCTNVKFLVAIMLCKMLSVGKLGEE